MEYVSHAAITGNQEALRAVLTSPDKPDDLNMCLAHPPEGEVNMSPLSLATLSGSVACTWYCYCQELWNPIPILPLMIFMVIKPTNVQYLIIILF